MQENFDLSTGQLSEEFQWDFVIAHADLVAWGVCFDREFEFSVFMMGKWLWIAYFSYIGFSYYRCISEQLLPQSLEPTFSVREGERPKPSSGLFVATVEVDI